MPSNAITATVVVVPGVPADLAIVARFYRMLAFGPLSHVAANAKNAGLNRTAVRIRSDRPYMKELTMSSPSPRRALVVIDVQNEYVTGKLRIEYPPIEQSLANIGRAMDAARAAGVPIVVVQQDAPPESPLFAKGSAGWQLHAVVADRPFDHHVHKTLPSAFPETDLAAWLAQREVDTLAIVGYMTHNCDASTINHATHQGLAVEFLADATGSLPYANDAGRASAEEIHRVYSVVFHSRFAAVTSTEAWIAAVDAGRPIPRDNIMASNQRGRAA
jgi:nicotinamidase-related amidase